MVLITSFVPVAVNIKSPICLLFLTPYALHRLRLGAPRGLQGNPFSVSFDICRLELGVFTLQDLVE